MEEPRSASAEWLANSFPNYKAAEMGLRNYWYPVMFSRSLGSKPKAITLLGEKIVLVRNGIEVHALHDRCPHRGTPLSFGEVHKPGTLSCAYHGFTYDVITGQLVAVLTDRPDSPICTKANVSVKTYPSEVRAGLIWVYVGDEDPPPVEDDVPTELLHENPVVEGRIKVDPGNWRLATEAGIDEGHARYLHRTSLWFLFQELPAWTKFHMEINDGWLERCVDEMHYSDNYSKVGKWPSQERAWRSRNRKGARHQSVRLPGTFRLEMPGYYLYNFFIPVDKDHYLSVRLSVAWPKNLLRRLWYKVRYWTYIHWLYNGQFHGQDVWMVDNIEIPPERLYGPDKSITSWRSLCEKDPRRSTRGSAEIRTKTESVTPS